jgi:hypothetical protein
MTTSSPVALASLLSFAIWLPGQQIAGIAHGFDGKPSAAIVVRALGAHGNTLGEIATTPDGRFTLTVAQPIQAVIVQAEGVQFRLPVENGGDAALVLSFAGVAHFTVQGRLLDPAGKAMVGVDVACRDAARRTIATPKSIWHEIATSSSVCGDARSTTAARRAPRSASLRATNARS